MRIRWTTCVALAIAACECGDEHARPAATAPALAPWPAAERSWTPTIPEDACARLIETADLEDLCGVEPGSARSEIGPGRGCVRRFKATEPGRRSSVGVLIDDEEDAKGAGKAYGKHARRVGGEAGYEAVEGIGRRAHAFAFEGGREGDTRSGPAIEFLAGRYVGVVRAPYGAGSTPLCSAKALREVAARVAQRVSAWEGGGEAEPPSAPAASSETAATVKPATTAQPGTTTPAATK